MQGKKQELRIESLAALEKAIKNVLSILGLMPTSYSEVVKSFNGLVILSWNITSSFLMATR